MLNVSTLIELHEFNGFNKTQLHEFYGFGTFLGVYFRRTLYKIKQRYIHTHIQTREHTQEENIYVYNICVCVIIYFYKNMYF